jgi:peptide deformylase
VSEQERDDVTREVDRAEEAPEEAEGLDREVRERRRQALAQVRKFGDPVLKSAAAPVTELDDDLRAEAERMVGIMRDSLGIGLAATQLGLMRRVLVFQAGPDSEPRALVNPEVEWLSGDLSTAEEGCLSIPGVVVDVERPLHARVVALDLDGSEVLLEASGLEARVLQHEIDHLDGVLILDRTLREQRRAALRALRSGEAFAPDMLEEPTEGDEDAELEPIAGAERAER